MKIVLSKEEKEELETHHRQERDGRVRDRLKAILLYAEGWQQIQIAQALRIHCETVHDHIEDYKRSRKLKPENGGSKSALTADQTRELIAHLEAHTYSKVLEICLYIEGIAEFKS